MMASSSSDRFPGPVDPRLHNRLQNPQASDREQMTEFLYDLLMQAATTEHLLSMQYLFACFSLKKYPEEFSDYVPGATAPAQQRINQVRLAQIEIIRRWEANMLMVAREEMEHLCYVQNLLAIIDKPPYLFRPNFPVPASAFPLQKPVNLMPFGNAAIQVFRYWEKPAHLPVPDPLKSPDMPEHLKPLFQALPHVEAKPFNPEAMHEQASDWLLDLLDGKMDAGLRAQFADPLRNGSVFNSIEALYYVIKYGFKLGLEYKIIEGKNMERIVNEHFGFNMALNPLVLGQYYSYVEQSIQQIIEEGEGVWGVPPPLGSHFWVFQNILQDLIDDGTTQGLPFEPALPVASNPTVAQQLDRHLASLQHGAEGEASLFRVDNAVAAKAMILFNTVYNTMLQMLNGFFADYQIDQTTGLRPNHVNAYFQTVFYPFMTMIVRPLGELVCRLPASASYEPGSGRVPPVTAGPDFLIDIPVYDQALRHSAVEASDDVTTYTAAFNEMVMMCKELATDCANAGYHMANYQQVDARDFPACFTYLAESIGRISQNFTAYWNGQMKAPVPSRGFQNFPDSYN
jgi:hypothetical protein